MCPISFQALGLLVFRRAVTEVLARGQLEKQTGTAPHVGGKVHIYDGCRHDFTRLYLHINPNRQRLRGVDIHLRGLWPVCSLVSKLVK